MNMDNFGFFLIFLLGFSHDMMKDDKVENIDEDDKVENMENLGEN